MGDCAIPLRDGRGSGATPAWSLRRHLRPFLHGASGVRTRLYSLCVQRDVRKCSYRPMKPGKGGIRDGQRVFPQTAPLPPARVRRGAFAVGGAAVSARRVGSVAAARGNAWEPGPARRPVMACGSPWKLRPDTGAECSCGGKTPWEAGQAGRRHATADVRPGQQDGSPSAARARRVRDAGTCARSGSAGSVVTPTRDGPARCRAVRFPAAREGGRSHPLKTPVGLRPGLLGGPPAWRRRRFRCADSPCVVDRPQPFVQDGPFAAGAARRL